MSADLGNTAVISPTDASNGTGTQPSWLGSAAPSTLDDAGRALQGAVAREWQNRSYVTSSGTAPNFVVAQTVAPAAYRSGQTYTFTAHAAAVGSDDVNFNTLGAKAIKKVVAGTKTATAANDFYAGDKISCVYDGTDMVWENTAANTAAALALKANLTANTFTATQTIQSSDDGAAVGPTLILDRASASPAANDLIGYIMFRGKDAGGNNVAYGEITTQINDTTDGNEDAEMLIGTVIAGTNAASLYVGNGMYMAGATGSAQGAGTINAQEYYKNGLRATRHLISTLTTTSGTTHQVTDIPAYRELYIEVAGVSFNASATMTLAVSDDNGSNYGTARAIAVATGSAGGVIHGTIRISNMQNSDMFAVAQGITAIAPTATATVLSVVMGDASVTGGPYNAIRFAGGTFDAGTIRVYGLL